MEKLQFTKEIKTKWLGALKSGEYTQGAGKLKSYNGKHCCLGVLAEVHPDLGIDETGVNCIVNSVPSGYTPFRKMLGNMIGELYEINDDHCDGKYTAVIPIIEQLPTVD